MPAAARSIRESLAGFAQRDLLAWKGLTSATTLADLEEVFSVDRGFSGTDLLGRGFEPAQWVAAMGDGFPDGVRVWLREERVVLLDAQRMQLNGPVEEVLAELGEPAARWDAFVGPMPAPQGEWVYPGRGLTVYVGPGTPWVDRVLGYSPTTLENYAEALRPHTRVDPLPDSGSWT